MANPRILHVDRDFTPSEKQNEESLKSSSRAAQKQLKSSLTAALKAAQELLLKQEQLKCLLKPDQK